MKPIGILSAALLALVLGTSVSAQQKATLNLVTAGDQNMVDYVKDYLAPIFEKEHPGVTVRAVGTGPGDAGSQKIYEKLEAEKDNSSWDIDVAVIHQKAAGEMVTKGLLARYVANVPTGQLVSSEAAKRALGANVDGYVIPMFNSQTAIAYNTAMVKDPPATYAELERWVAQNPKKFGYNGIKGGMSGVSFVVGWVYAHTSDADRLMKGPYDPDSKKGWDDALAKLAAFNKNVVLTPGNAGTLDMLNRGEIAMGPVWVDMFYTWQADGKIPPTVKRAGHAGPADVLCGAGQGGEPQSCRGIHRAGDEPEGASRRHRQALQLVSRHRRGGGQGAARRGDLAEIVRRCDARGSRDEGKTFPNRAIFQRHPREL